MYMSLIIVIMFVVISAYPSSEYTKLKLHVMQKPKDPRAHLQLARVAAQNSDWDVASREFRIAFQVLSNSNKSVAGITSDYQQVERQVYAKGYLEKEIDYWQSLLNDQPGYLDAYLNLSLIHYQLFDEDLSRDYWRKAWKIDPNDEDVITLGKLIGVNQFVGLIE